MTCSCDNTNRITIVRGNDTNFNGVTFLTLNITSSIWDLSELKASLSVGGLTKQYNDLSSGTIDVSFTAAETATMPFGNLDGVLRFYNAENQVFTAESLLPFKVISIVHGNAIAVTPATYNITVEQGGETVLNIDVEAGVSVSVGTTTTLPAGSDATVTNSGTNSRIVLDFGIPRGEDGQDGKDGVDGKDGKDGVDGKDGKDGADGKDGQDGEDGKDATINGVNTLTLNAVYGVSLSQSGSTATISGKEITDVVDGISAVIPAQATEQNQLADKAFVNSSVATNTANFIGTFNSVADLENYSGTLTNNDYAFVISTDSAGNTVYNRYKYTTATTPASWVFEYALNNSSFTSNQWASINSGATTTNIGQIGTNTTAIGTLSSLTTTVQSDLVSAVNEVNATASGKVSDVQFNGTSITTSGVANVEIATQAQVQAKSATGNPLTPSNIDDIGGSVSRSVYDNVQAITAGAINLVDGSVFYTTSPTDNTAYTISTSALTQTGFSYRYFNVILTQPSVPVTCDFTTNNNVTWVENTTPDLSTGGRTYLLAFQTFDGGSNWVGSLCTWWE